MSPGHAAILLAAGASTRLGQAKQLIVIDGESLLRRTARALLATQPLELVVVLGHDADMLRATIVDLPARPVVAADFASGMSASLRRGISALNGNCVGALIALTDQFGLQAAHLIALRNAWREMPEFAVASAYANVLGVPAVLPRTWFADIARLRGDVGARALLRERAHQVVAIDAPKLHRDLDTPANLADLRDR